MSDPSETTAVEMPTYQLSYDEATRQKDRRLACIQESVRVHSGFRESGEIEKVIDYANDLFMYVENGLTS